MHLLFKLYVRFSDPVLFNVSASVRILIDITLNG